MRQFLPIFVLTLAGCPKEEPPAPAPEAAAEAAPAPVAEPEPEPAAAPEPVVNADLKVTLTHADGTTKAGHVKRIERSTDWYGEEGWSTEAADLKITGETDSAEKKVTWNDVKTVTVKIGDVKNDVDCFYSSDWSPWMYDCTLQTVGTLTLKDGSTWTVGNRHKWRFTFDDDTEAEFWLKKHSARQQDDERVDLDTVTPENYQLYTDLQDRVRAEARSSLVVKITVQ